MDLLKNLILLNLFFTISFAKIPENKKFVIVIPSYNNSQYYKQNLDSVFNQNYKDYRIIYIDDFSSDENGNLVKQYIKECKQEHKITLIQNKKRQLALANIYSAILTCENHEIVVMVDGDDQLADNDVLSKLNDVYTSEDVWITYGNYKNLSNNLPCEWNPTFPDYIVKRNQFRDFPHGLIHLRTFYAWLFKQIKLEDLFYEDAFYTMCSDVAIYTPMIEMAGEHYKYFNTSLYIYNDLNPINDHKISVGLQRFLNTKIRQKDKYYPLDAEKSDFLKFNNSKADLIIFADEFNDIDHYLKIIKNIENINKTFIFYETEDDIENKFESESNDVIILEKTKINKHLLNQIFIDLFKNGSEYIIFLDNKTNSFTDKINTTELIKTLELTKSFSLLLGTKNNAAEDLQTKNIEILNNTYAFHFNKVKLINSIKLAIYPKKNIDINHFKSLDKIEIEWKYIGWNKINLFSFLN